MTLTLFDGLTVPPTRVAGDTPRVRRGDPLASHEAADSITLDGRAASQRAVLEVLRLHGRLSAEAITDMADLAGWSFSPSRIRTAISEADCPSRPVWDDFPGSALRRVRGGPVNPLGRLVDKAVGDYMESVDLSAAEEARLRHHVEVAVVAAYRLGSGVGAVTPIGGRL